MNEMPRMNQDSRESPLVSVIMNCLNCEKYVKEAIDSVYSQTYRKWEIIFWDNASTDGSAAIAKSYDDRLRYFRGKETVPLGGARNMALERATGEYIAFLDCDDLWLPKKLEKQIPLFNDSDVGLVFCDTIAFNNAGETRRFNWGRSYYTGHCFAQLLKDYCLSLVSVVVRRSALGENVNWFDPRFNIIEEVDLFLRIAYRWKLAMVPETLSKWRVHSDSWSWSKNYLAADERVAMLSKFEEVIPNFRQKFGKEIAVVERKNTVNRAKNLWKFGEARAARQEVFPCIFKYNKAFILYFLSFFPEKRIIRWINKIRNNMMPQ